MNTNGGRNTLHIYTMISVCWISHRGTFSLRVECKKEGEMVL